MPVSARIGVFNVGFHRYWPQFPGLEDRLKGYGQQVARTLDRPRRLFSVALIGLGCACLLFTTGLLDTRVIGPGILIALGLLLVWRRLR